MKTKIFLIFIALFSGFLGGVLGYSFFRSYINNYSNSISFLREYDLSNLNNGTPLVISGAKSVVVQADTKRIETISNSLKSIAGIYRQKKSTNDASADILANLYGKNEALASGIIVTNDGWMLAFGLPADFTLANSKNFKIVGPDQRIYGIKNVIESNNDGFLYIKIDTDAKDFAPGMFLPMSSDVLGSEGLMIGWNGALSSALFLDSGYSSNLVMFSDSLSKEYKISNTQDESLLNTPVFNLGGQLVGFLNKQDKVMSINFLGDEIADLLKNGKIIQPKLGVYYRDLSDYYSSAEKPEKGVLIVKNAQGVGVVKNSSAEKAGLKIGDVILAVDNTELDKKNKFNEVVSAYSPGDKISLTIMRGSVKNKIDLILN